MGHSGNKYCTSSPGSYWGEKKKTPLSIEMVGAQTDWMCFLFLILFLSRDVCFILPKPLGPFKRIIAHVFETFFFGGGN